MVHFNPRLDSTFAALSDATRRGVLERLGRGDASITELATAFDGEVGILPRHAPMMTLLGKGTLRIGSGASAVRFAVEGGFLQVVDDVVRVVTEKATAA